MLKLFRNPLALIIITFFTVIFYISLSKTQQKNETVTKQIENISVENQELQENISVLEKKLSSINPEQMIRDEFLMKKEGEYVVKLPPPPPTTDQSAKATSLPVWRQWWELVF